MGIELRQNLQLAQQLIMTPQLQMAIKLLQLSRLELADMITHELKENPTLEEVNENQATDDPQLPDQTEVTQTPEPAKTEEVEIKESIDPDIDWNNYLDEYNSAGKTHYESEHRDAPEYESFVAKKDSLNDHLLWQLLMLRPTEEQQEIGSLLIGNLNKDGYLESSVEGIAQRNSLPLEKIEAVLSLLQTFDPPGVCARDLSECLELQTKNLGINNPAVSKIIKTHIKNLENKNYKAISKDLKISLDDVVSAVNIIRELEPKPGRAFSDEQPQYIIPDIYVYKMEDDFLILLNDDGLPKLRINPVYREAMNKGKKITGNTKDYLQDKMRSATWLIRSIQQRQKTIYKVMESILKFQRDFFEKGIAFLKPMVLRDVAEDIEMHESTISRVTTNKYAFTPQGIFELKYFFNSPINRLYGDAIASASVHDKIKKIIESENPKKPFSDDKISKLLKEQNINIARRTVAKYREVLGVLPSNKRKQF